MSVQQASQEGPCEAVPRDGFTTVAEHSSRADRDLPYEAIRSRIYSVQPWMQALGSPAALRHITGKKKPQRCGAFLKVADRTGLEPATSGVTGRHSNQLNYRSADRKSTRLNSSHVAIS